MIGNLLPNNKDKKQSVYILLLIFLIGVVLRITPILILEFKTPGWHENNVNEIEFYYDDVARSLLVGNGFVHSVNPRSVDQKFKFTPGTPFSFVPPLYAWFLYLVYSVIGPSILGAKIVQSVMDASVCILIYLLGKRIFAEQRISLLASFLYAVYPLAIILCSTLYYQIPMNLALCWMLICFMSAVTVYNGIWTGIALGLASLAKPVTLPLLLLMPVVRLVEAFWEKRPISQPMKWISVFLLFAILSLTPWTVRNYMVFHKFIPIQKGAGAPLLQGSKEEYIDLDVDNLRIIYAKDFKIDPKDTSKIAINNHLEHLKKDPIDYFRFLGKKFILTWYNTEGKSKNLYVFLVQIPFLFFALISLIFSAKSWIKSPNWYVPGIILFICGIQVVFFPLVRYTLVIMPFVMIMTANGMFIAFYRLRKTLSNNDRMDINSI